MTIASSSITFVVQGGIDKSLTGACLESIRRNFPQSPIVLSTWVGSNVTGLSYDELVLSEDPGFCYYSIKPDAKPNNVNRQIVSSREGLKRVKTPYAFKIRTDFLISGQGFLQYWDAFPAAGDFGGLFKHKILACCYFTRNPADLKNPYRYPFHLSDLAFFGETQDLLALFDIPLMPKEEEHWIKDGSVIVNRYVPEQYIFVNFLRARGRQVSFDYYGDMTPENVIESEKYLASNCVLLTFKQFGLSSDKKHFSMKYNSPSFHTCYTHDEWLALYRKYADPSAALPAVDAERREIERYYGRYKWIRRLATWMTGLIIWPRSLRTRMRIRLRQFLLGDKNL